MVSRRFNNSQPVVLFIVILIIICDYCNHRNLIHKQLNLDRGSLYANVVIKLQFKSLFLRNLTFLRSISFIQCCLRFAVCGFVGKKRFIVVKVLYVYYKDLWSSSSLRS